MNKAQLNRIEQALRRKRGTEQVTFDLVWTYTDANGQVWVELPDGRVMDQDAYLEEVQRRGGRVIALKWDDEQGEG